MPREGLANTPHEVFRDNRWHTRGRSHRPALNRGAMGHPVPAVWGKPTPTVSVGDVWESTPALFDCKDHEDFAAWVTC